MRMRLTRDVQQEADVRRELSVEFLIHEGRAVSPSLSPQALSGTCGGFMGRRTSTS